VCWSETIELGHRRNAQQRRGITLPNRDLLWRYGKWFLVIVMLWTARHLTEATSHAESSPPADHGSFWVLPEDPKPTNLAGESVVFSTATNRIQSPYDLGKESKLEGSVDPAMKPPAPAEFDAPISPINPANPLPNRALQMFLDRQRNWAFMTRKPVLSHQQVLIWIQKQLWPSRIPPPKWRLKPISITKNQTSHRPWARMDAAPPGH